MECGHCGQIGQHVRRPVRVGYSTGSAIVIVLLQIMVVMSVRILIQMKPGHRDRPRSVTLAHVNVSIMCRLLCHLIGADGIFLNIHHLLVILLRIIRTAMHWNTNNENPI